MKIIVAICQVIVGCGLLNVWLLRFGRATAYRGATAGSMLEEFAAYGLPAWFCYVVGFLKVTSAICLLAGLLYPWLVLPAAVVVAVLMAGAIAMHVKVSDPLKKYLPALSMLLLCAVILAEIWLG